MTALAEPAERLQASLPMKVPERDHGDFEAIKEAVKRGFRVTTNATLFDGGGYGEGCDGVYGCARE